MTLRKLSATESPGHLLIMKIPDSHPRPVGPESLRVKPRHLHWTNSTSKCDACQHPRTTRKDEGSSFKLLEDSPSLCFNDFNWNIKLNSVEREKFNQSEWSPGSHFAFYCVDIIYTICQKHNICYPNPHKSISQLLDESGIFIMKAYLTSSNNWLLTMFPRTRLSSVEVWSNPISPKHIC